MLDGVDVTVQPARPATTPRSEIARYLSKAEVARYLGLAGVQRG